MRGENRKLPVISLLSFSRNNRPGPVAARSKA